MVKNTLSLLNFRAASPLYVYSDQNTMGTVGKLVENWYWKLSLELYDEYLGRQGFRTKFLEGGLGGSTFVDLDRAEIPAP